MTRHENPKKTGPTPPGSGVVSDRRVWKRLSTTIAARLRVPDAQLSVAGAMGGLGEAARLESFAAWLSYQQAADVFECVLADDAEAGIDVTNDLRSLDTHAQVGARIGAARCITAYGGQTLLSHGLVLRHRLPQTALCLRDGLISPKQITIVIELTELIEDPEVAATVDAEIAAALRGRKAGWDNSALRAMVNGRVFAHDPDSVRHARKRQSMIARHGCPKVCTA